MQKCIATAMATTANTINYRLRVSRLIPQRLKRESMQVSTLIPAHICDRLTLAGSNRKVSQLNRLPESFGRVSRVVRYNHPSHLEQAVEWFGKLSQVIRGKTDRQIIICRSANEIKR